MRIIDKTGPLANPASVTRQLVGVPSPEFVPLYREAMTMLGTDRAMIVSGEEGLDELSIAGPSRIAAIGLNLTDGQLVPEDAGLPRHSLEALRGGEPRCCAAQCSGCTDRCRRSAGLARWGRRCRRGARQGTGEGAARLLD